MTSPSQNANANLQAAQAAPLFPPPPFVIDASAKTAPNLPTLWLVPDWLPDGELCLLCGSGGVGKGLVYCWLAAMLTARKTLPNGNIIEPCNIMVFNAEDSLQKVLNPRLDAAGADRDLVHIVNKWPDAQSQAIGAKDLDPRYFFGHLREVVPKYAIQLVIVDPILRGLRDSNSDMEIRANLENWQDLAHDTGVTVLGIAHNKKRGVTAMAEGQMIELVRGSSAIAECARMAWLLVADRSDTDKHSRLLVRGKYNLPVENQNQYFRLTSELVDQGLGQGVKAHRVVLDEVISGDVEVAVAKAMRQPTGADNELSASNRSNKQAACDFAFNLLSLERPHLLARDVYQFTADEFHLELDTVRKMLADLTKPGGPVIQYTLRHHESLQAEFPNAHPNAKVWGVNPIGKELQQRLDKLQ